MDLREFKQKSCKEPLHMIKAMLPHCLRDNIRRVKLKSDTSKEKTKPSFYSHGGRDPGLCQPN